MSDVCEWRKKVTWKPLIGKYNCETDCGAKLFIIPPLIDRQGKDGLYCGRPVRVIEEEKDET